MLARIFFVVLLILTAVTTYTQTHQHFFYPYSPSNATKDVITYMRALANN